MKSSINVLLFLIISFNLCEAQPHLAKTIEINKKTSVYYLNKVMVSSYMYKFCNNGRDTVWLWFEKTNRMELTDSVIIKSYFYTFKSGADFNLYQIGLDGNVELFIPEIYNTFLKVILPNQSFSVQIISQEPVLQSKEQEFDSYLNEHLIYFPRKTILKYIPSFNSVNSIIFFKSEFITLFEQDLMK
jgi:hypothetical protein